MQVTLHLEHCITPAPDPQRRDVDSPGDHDGAAQRDSHVPHVAAMFGLGVDDDAPLALIPPTDLTLRPGRLIFVTGPSGSGKSTLLRLIDEALRGRDSIRLIRFDRLPPLPDRPLVDCFDHPLDAVLEALSRAGLGDARVMLRRPGELSDGQRYRVRLAQTMLSVEAIPDAGSASAETLTVVLADEFGATLDRLTATVLASRLRQWVTRAGVCFVAATTHDDLLEPLNPDVLIHKPLGSAMHVGARP